MKFVRFSMAMLPLLMLAKASPALRTIRPINDKFSGAKIAYDGFNEELDTTRATTDGDDLLLSAGCGIFPTTKASVWYKYTADSDATVLVDYSGSDYYTGVIVGKGTRDNLSFVTCVNKTSVPFNATAGTPYYVLAFDRQYDDKRNGGFMSIWFEEVKPPVLESFIVDSSGSVNTSTGVAMISGTYSCTGDVSYIDVSVSAHQKVNGVTIWGNASLHTEATCDGEQPWSAEVYPGKGNFTMGQLLTNSYAEVSYKWWWYDSQEVQQTVQLSRVPKI